MWVMGLNLGPLEEQSMLLTADPSLQPQNSTLGSHGYTISQLPQPFYTFALWLVPPIYSVLEPTRSLKCKLDLCSGSIIL